jgi:hypothetical protein
MSAPLVDRPTRRSILVCGVCSARVAVRTLASPNPDAPDLLEVPFAWWVGVVASGGHGADPNARERVADPRSSYVALLCVCSPRCAQTLLRA